MKKTLLLSVLITTLFSTVYGQNLVPNPSFEEKSGCPTSDDQIELADGWFKSSYSSSTPDYFNACSTPEALGVPRNGFAFQEEANGCQSYIGLAVWPPDPFSVEYVSIKLNNPLQTGKKYFMSFLTVPDLLLIGGIQAGLSSNNIGLLFTKGNYNKNAPLEAKNYAHLNSSQIITDTVHWKLIQGSFIADSNYSYIHLGNFFDYKNTDTLSYNCPSCQNANGYYLVDNVCVSEDSLTCSKLSMKLPCNVGLYDRDQEYSFISPNPFSDLVTININHETPIDDIYIIDLNGVTVFEVQHMNNNLSIELSSLQSGAYFIYGFKNGIEVIKQLIIKT